MAKAWRIIVSATLICVLLGAVFVLVGMITGGELQRIMNMFNARFDIPALTEAAKTLVHNVIVSLPTF